VLPAGSIGVGAAAAGFLASWWIYVPLHELLHALGCQATGGRVWRLEIDSLYGASLVRRVFPFVEVGSSYAGRLTGFDTRGSDLVFLATDFAPYVLTILLGVPLLRAIPRVRWRQPWRAGAFGAALPLAYAPFLSLGGDYYEMGSIVVTRLLAHVRPGFDLKRWRSDDVIELASKLFPAAVALDLRDVTGLCASLAVGVILSVATYAAGILSCRVARSIRSCTRRDTERAHSPGRPPRSGP
jgi:hypothetical protein